MAQEVSRLAASLFSDALKTIEKRKVEGEKSAILYGINRHLLDSRTIEILQKLLKEAGYKTRVHPTHNLMVEWD